MVIMDEYDALGIGDRDTLVHSIGASGNPDKYQFLVAFARSVINTALPVELVDFSGVIVDNRIQLNWQTATETNNQKFVVEESRDGQIFRAIGELSGNGTTTRPQDYTFWVDRPRSGLSYYRLKQIDFDGQFAYSKVVSLNFGRNNTQVGSLYPNPSKLGIVQVDYTAQHADEITISAFDQFGNRVTSQRYQIVSGNNQLRIDCTDLNSGVYIIRIGEGEKATYQKLMIN